MSRDSPRLNVTMLGKPVQATRLPDGQYQIVSPFDGESATLSGDVATALIQNALPEKVLEASLEGIVPAPSSAVATAYQNWITQLRQQLPDGPAVLFDSTTVDNALQAVTGANLVTPLRLLDLSLLTYAALTADKIVVQPSGRASYLAAQHPELFCVLGSPGKRFEEDLLRSSNLSVEGFIRDAPGMTASLEAAWRSFLTAGRGGADWVRLDAREFDRHWESPQYWDNVIAVDYEEGLLSRCFAGSMPPDDLSRSRTNLFITVQTYRAFRNFGVAGLLGIPYQGSVLRLPAYSMGMQVIRSRASAIERILSRAAGQGAPEPSPGVIRLKAPVPLQLVLKRMHEPRDYFDVLEGLRDEFKGLRHDIYQRQVGGEEPESIVDDYRQMLDKLSSQTTSAGPIVAFGAAAAAIPFVFLTPSHILLSADAIAGALGTLSSIPCFQGVLARWVGRASRRCIVPLLALGEQAGTVSALADDVQRIWHYTWSNDKDAILDGVARGAKPFAFLAGT